MTSAGRSLVLRWLLLAVVAFGLVVMHHLPAQHDADSGGHLAETSVSVMALDPAPAANPMPDTGGMGVMWHMCLAVTSLFAVAALVLLLLLVGAFRGTRQPPAWAATALARARDRPPPGLGGRTILDSVCVLRL